MLKSLQKNYSNIINRIISFNEIEGRGYQTLVLSVNHDKGKRKDLNIWDGICIYIEERNQLYIHTHHIKYVHVQFLSSIIPVKNRETKWNCIRRKGGSVHSRVETHYHYRPTSANCAVLWTFNITSITNYNCSINSNQLLLLYVP